MAKLLNTNRMKTVILDGYTANPGDLSWEPLKEIGELTVYDSTRAEKTVERAKDAAKASLTYTSQRFASF